MRGARNGHPTARALLDRHFESDRLAELLGTAEEPALAHARHALWTPLSEMLSRPSKGVRASLVEHAFAVARASGNGAGSLQQLPAQLPQLVELLHAGSLIVDDVEDAADTRRGGPALHKMIGVPLAINAGNFLYFLAQRTIDELQLEPLMTLKMHQVITRSLLRCHHGQALDLSLRVNELKREEIGPVVELATSLKTGALLELACALGAIAGGASPALQQALTEFGCQVGTALQMLDDLSGFLNPARNDKALEDLGAQRPTWAWALAAARLDAHTWAIWQRLAGGQEKQKPYTSALLALMSPILERFRNHPRSLVEHAVARLHRAAGDQPAMLLLAEELRALEHGFL